MVDRFIGLIVTYLECHSNNLFVFKFVLMNLIFMEV
ncbi:Uncharacterised protein [Vibrio harveyi]|jgi:hypothetical protein|nr:Uncharacterised protein [Vibrio harveyi]